MWKNRAAWLLIFLAALGLYLFENNTGTRCLLAAAVLLPVCSALCLYLPRYRVSAALTLPETLRRGEAAAIALTLRNHTALPAQARAEVCICNLLTGETAALPVSGALGRREERAFPFTLCFAHCGVAALSVDRIELTDLLGLFLRRLPAPAMRTAVVPPEAWPVEVALAETADALRDSESYSAQKPGYDPGETFRIREYVPGDPIRQIHWKLSEKTDRVLVRDFGLPVAQRMLLLLETTALDGAPIAPDDLDTMLDLLCSVSTALLARDVPHTVGWHDRRVGAYTSREVVAPEELTALWDTLLANPVAAGETSVAGSYGQSRAECAYAHVAVISPCLAPDIDLLCRGNRVTALLTAETERALGSGAEVVSFTEEALHGGTLCLEL